jgi:hypothetical protein
VRVDISGSNLDEVGVDEVPVCKASIHSKDDAELEFIALLSSPLDISKNRDSTGSNRQHRRKYERYFIVYIYIYADILHM